MKRGRSVWKKGRSSAKRTGEMLSTVRKRKRHSVSTRSSLRKVIYFCSHTYTGTQKSVNHSLMINEKQDFICSSDNGYH